MSEKKTEFMCLRLTEDERRAVKAVAEKLEQTEAWVVRVALRTYIAIKHPETV